MSPHVHLCRRCGREPADSQEHIVLNALGGKHRVSGLWCVHCNNKLGKLVDDPLVKTLLPFSVLLGCRRGDGDPVEPWKDARTRDGEVVTVLPGGRPVPRLREPMPSPIQTPDGRTQVRVVGRNEEEVAYYLAHQARRLGVSIDAMRAVETSQASTWLDAVGASSSVGGDNWGRAVAKMAIAAVCKALGRAAVDSMEMRPIVDYALTGASGISDWPPMSPAVDDRQHLRRFSKARLGQHILLVYEPGRRGVEASFAAFGCLTFRLQLTRAPLGIGGTLVHVVDAIAGTHRCRRAPGGPPISTPIEQANLTQGYANASMKELGSLIDEVQIRQLVNEEAAAAWSSLDDRRGGTALSRTELDLYIAEVERLVQARLRRENTQASVDVSGILARAREILPSIRGRRRK